MTDDKKPGGPPPEPTHMPVDREEWFTQLHLCNFVNSYYQYRDVSSLPDIKKILLIGPGQGLDTTILRWRGYEVTTLDIDGTFKPDIVASLHDLSMIGDGEYDVAIASHVLEHMAVEYLDVGLENLARVARYSVVYLPVHGRHMQLRFIPGFKGIDLSFIFDFFNRFKEPDGVTPSYMGGQHFWEVGLKGFTVRDLKKRFSGQFEVLDCYRNRDWLPSQNFVLRSKRNG